METNPTLRFVFVFFLVTSTWTLLSILAAVVSENMMSTCGAQQEELRMISHEQERIVHLNNLKNLFKSIDIHKTGELPVKDLETLLDSRESAEKVAKLVKVPVRNVR